MNPQPGLAGIAGLARRLHKLQARKGRRTPIAGISGKEISDRVQQMCRILLHGHLCFCQGWTPHPRHLTFFGLTDVAGKPLVQVFVDALLLRVGALLEIRWIVQVRCG